MLKQNTYDIKWVKRIEIYFWEMVVFFLKKSKTVRKVANAGYTFIQTYSARELIMISVLTVLAGLISGFMLSYLSTFIYF
ncbi:MAG: hypothetical protein JEZ06_02125 [Anaerolineaceae bacterium]|nr:hypothetical protein [Anaerolineaceae bacterium]